MRTNTSTGLWASLALVAGYALGYFTYRWFDTSLEKEEDTDIDLDVDLDTETCQKKKIQLKPMSKELRASPAVTDIPTDILMYYPARTKHRLEYMSVTSSWSPINFAISSIGASAVPSGTRMTVNLTRWPLDQVDPPSLLNVRQEPSPNGAKQNSSTLGLVGQPLTQETPLLQTQTQEPLLLQTPTQSNPLLQTQEILTQETLLLQTPTQPNPQEMLSPPTHSADHHSDVSPVSENPPVTVPVVELQLKSDQEQSADPTRNIAENAEATSPVINMDVPTEQFIPDTTFNLQTDTRTDNHINNNAIVLLAKMKEDDPSAAASGSA
jgi:hypothetical protein